MLTDSVLNECRELALGVAPELQSSPLYVLRSEEIDPQFNPRNCLGWACGGSRTIAFAEALGDRWRGIGNAIVLDGAAIASAALPGCFARVVRNVAIHEAAHLLPVLPPLPIPPDYKPSDGFKKMQCERLKNPQPEPPVGSEDDPHGWRFCRRAVHLAYRAFAEGADITLHNLFGPQEWMTPAPFYLAELLPECIGLAGKSFAEIEAEPAPAGFMALWQSDLRFRKFLCKGET